MASKASRDTSEPSGKFKHDSPSWVTFYFRPVFSYNTVLAIFPFWCLIGYHKLGTIMLLYYNKFSLDECNQKKVYDGNRVNNCALALRN